jgi:SAM-dependent methyltransferase
MFALKAIEDWPEYLRGPILRCASGELPPNVALMQMFASAASSDVLSAALVLATDAFEASGHGEAAARIRAAHDLWLSAPGVIDTVRAVLAEADGGAAWRTPGDTIGFWSGVFDRLAQAAPEAAVALYSLGRADVLDAATDEIVVRMRGWDLLDGERSMLEIGCGIGRFLTALSGEARLIAGLDISRGMLTEAAERCRGIGNVLLVQGSGRDLGAFRDGAFGLVYAIDSLPYIVEAGSAMVARCFAEAQRVLAPGGSFLIMNYSYRGSPDRDRDDVARLAVDSGLSVVESGGGGLRHWDGSVFRLIKPGE